MRRCVLVSLIGLGMAASACNGAARPDAAVQGPAETTYEATNEPALEDPQLVLPNDCPDGSERLPDGSCEVDPGDRIRPPTGMTTTDIQLSLWRVPGMKPDLAGASSHTSGQCPNMNTRSSGDWIEYCRAEAVLPSPLTDHSVAATIAMASIIEGTTVLGSPDPLVINPVVSAATSELFEYGWNASPGCYYVKADVVFPGSPPAVTFFSPIVGVPSGGTLPVDDLHLDLVTVANHALWMADGSTAAVPAVCIDP